jgi:very-short-patch-repair endonuclease
MTPGRDAAVAAVAGRQRTIVGHEQLLAIGYSRRAIGHWVKRRRLWPVFRGVYSLIRGQLPPLAREQAALIACGEHAFLSHRTAAAMLGLIRASAPNIDVTVVGRRCSSREGIRVHEIKAIDPREVHQHEGLWVSTPARAVLEIAATGSPWELARAIDEGLAHDVFTPQELKDVLARNRPCRGAGRLAAILGDETATAKSRSRSEKALLRMIRAAGLPLPDTNVKLGRFELDLFWPNERVSVEVDGYAFHRGPDAFNRDREKDLALKDAGIDGLRFTGDHVQRRSAMVLARIAAALARGGLTD